jgi:uncharacterized protein YdeI (YjbR/CyaY-like superfamily)
MQILNPKVDLYFLEGCGRCPLGGTPECNVHKWPKEMQRLRSIAIDCGLVEEVKWGVPCYTFEKSNVAIVAAFKEYCSISFFKGALLEDPKQALVKPGENSQAARLVKFTTLKQVVALEPVLKELIKQAIEVERKGLKVDFKAKTELEIPDELQTKFDQLPALKSAFHSLTPGRQRGYILHFTSAKQSKTRESRIEKCIPAILEGRGFHD